MLIPGWQRDILSKEVIRDGHLGLGFDVALTALDCSGWDSRRLRELREARTDAAGRPGITQLLPQRAEPFFLAELITGPGPVTFAPGYAILVVVAGDGELGYGSGSLAVRRGSTVLVPYAAGPTTLGGGLRAVRCLPPI